MVLKRTLADGEDDGYEFINHNSKQRIVYSNLDKNVTWGVSTQELASTLEPMIRRWVRDEVQRACQKFCCSSPRSPFNALEPCGATSLQLRFVTKFPRKLFTSSRVESEDNGAIKLVLFDTDSNKIVSSGPLSSLKIQIVPLDGDFSADNDEDWSPKDFEAKVISARDGKRPLVAGDLSVVLKDGVGDLGEVFFTDNSSWRRSRTFRLGAQAVTGVRIREAKSEPFVVKDHRGESYKKHHPPSLNDDIWRLEKIAKDGAFHKRLGLNRIRTVKDFLQVYVTNESSLRKILGGSCNKTWETIIKHAKECVLDDKLYMYNGGPQGVGLLFNSIFKIVGATFDAQNYFTLEELAGFQMPLVESLKQQFYKNLNGMIPMSDLSVFGPSLLTSNLPDNPLKSVANLALQDVNLPTLQTDEPQMQLTSSLNIYAFNNNNNSQSEVYISPDSSMQFFSSALRNSFKFKDFSNRPFGEGCSSHPGPFSDRVSADFGYQNGPLWQGNELCSTPFNQTENTANLDIYFSRNGSPINGSPRGRWCKIRAAVKWVSVMRDVTARRIEKFYPYIDFST